VALGKKLIPVNLNWYRRAHYRQIYAVEQAFQPLTAPPVRPLGRVRITYGLGVNGNRRTDAMNWLSVVDKLFCDWLVKSGWLADDTWREITGGEWTVGRVDGADHTIIATVEEVQDEQARACGVGEAKVYYALMADASKGGER
jgi:hypothetical protein